MDHQRRVTTSQKKQRLLSPSTTNHTTHNQTKKNGGTMIPPRSPASSGSNFLGECSCHMLRDRSQSALHGDAFFVYVQLTNSLFYLLLFYAPAQRARWLKVSFFIEYLPFFLFRFIESMRTDPSYMPIYFLPMPHRYSSCSGMFSDEGGRAPWSRCLHSVKR